MTEPLLDIYFTGRLHSGVTAEQAREHLARLFRTEPERLEHLFSGKPQLVKRGVDQAMADRYREALRQAGMQVAVRPHGTPMTAATPRRAPGLSLAPPGTDLLRPSERQRITAIEVDISHLDLAGPDPGPLALPATVAAALPDTSHLGLAPAGSDLLDEAGRPPAPAPLPAPAFELAPPGSQLLDGTSRRPTPPPPQTDHLQLQPDD